MSNGASGRKGDYVLVSPCRNEQEFMRRTLDSVLAQTLRPSQWVIVDDGSTDDTPNILREYSQRQDWMKIVRREDRGHRAVGPGVVDAFYDGYRSIDVEFTYFCKLDLDLELPSRYFEILVDRMDSDPNLATCSGKSYISKGGRLVFERHGDETSLGMTKFYRDSSFQAIGGFVREINWDAIDCHLCRMNGWIACSWNEPELRFTHLRPMGSSQVSVYAGRRRYGYGQYFMGTGFLFMLASALSRVNQRPYVFGSLAILWAWLEGAIARKPRYDNPKFRRFLRAYQRRALLVGKARAVELMMKTVKINSK